MNKVFLIGNLTRDPELNETPSGVSVCRFSIAVGRNYTQGDGERQTDFFNCVAWRGLGENIAQYCKKGNKVAVSGSIQLRNYEDNQGIKRTAVDIITQDIEFLTPKSREDEVMEEPTPRRKRPTLQPMDDDSDCPF
jgi:single-strand DNA-binding protein